MLEVPVQAHFSTLVPVQTYDRKDTKQSGYATSQLQHAWIKVFEIRGHGRDHGVLAPLLSPGLHVVDSNVHEIIGTDPQVQLSAYIQFEGMDQVRSNRIVNLHVMDITHSITRLPQRKT